jgi:hypothetical protein
MAGETVQGVKEAAKALRQIDPELRKEFNANVRQIAAPIVDAAKASYNDYIIPSGTRRNWTQRDRKLFPFTAAAARRGVRTKIDTRARSRSSIKVVQSNPAAAIYEFAGQATPNALGRAFTYKGRKPARVMWPSAEMNIGKVTDEMKELVKDVERTIQKELG